MKNIHNISAGAGAGKTTELVKIISELVSGKRTEGKCLPDRMILTTFTKAAAAEFRERVKQKLFSEKMIEEAIAIDAAQMGTISSVSESYLRRYWYLLGMSPDLSPIDENESRSLMNEALMDIITSEDIVFFHQYASDFSLINEDGDADSYWKAVFMKIADLVLGGRITFDMIQEWGNRSARMLEEAFKPTTDLVEFRRAVESYCAFCRCEEDIFYNSSSKNNAETQAELLEESKDKHTLSVRYLKKVNAVLGNKAFGLKKKAKPQYEIPLQDAFDALKDAITHLVPEEAANIAVFARRISQVASKGIDAYKKAKQKAGVIDFSDMEGSFLKLLDKEEVRQGISASIDYLFVDEFQDSNYIQIEIFKKLSDLVKQSWFVGDMKQAIYGFRGSDTELVADFSHCFPVEKEDRAEQLTHFMKDANGLSSQTLRDSYRSVPELVELSNKVFVSAFKEPYLRMVGNQEVYRYDKEVLDEDQVTLNIKRSSLGNSLFHLNLHNNDGTRSNALPYDAFASFVCMLLNGSYLPLKGRNIKPEDVAVLVRNNDHVAKIAAALRKKRVPVTAVGKDFIESAEVALLLDILRLTADVQTKKTRVELMSLIHALPLRTVFDYAQGKEGNYPKLDGIEAFARSLRRSSVVDSVDAIITRFGLYDYSSRWDNADQRRENLDLVRTIAQEYDNRCQMLGKNSDFRGFLSYVAGYKPEPQFNINAAGVKVLTSHKAKGLEWPVVFLWQISGSSGSAKKNSTCGVDPDWLVPPFSACDWASECVIASPQLQQIRDRNEAKELGESRRLLYVGVTRARDILFTVGKDQESLTSIPRCCPTAPENPIVSEDGSTIDVWGVGIDSEYADVHDAPDLSFEKALTKTMLPMNSVFPLLTEKEAGELKYRNPSKYRDDGVMAGAKAEIIHDMGHRVDIKHPGLEDNEFGDCIHHIYAACRADAPEKSRVVASRTLRNWGIEDPEAPEKVAASYEALCTFLTEKYGSAVSVDHEVPFMHQDTEGHVYSGVMDMLWNVPGGTVIIDFKTYGGNTAEAIKESITEHSSQMHEYCVALKAAEKTVSATVLYYPVTGVVVEVKTK